MTVRVGAAAAAVVLALLAGCSESDPPPTTSLPTTTASMPPTTSAASTTSAPTTEVGSAPTVPPAASEQSPDGAAAFVAYWFQTLSHSWATMDSSFIRDLGGCPTCIAFADTIDDVSARGDRLEGGETSVSLIEPGRLSSDGSTTVTATFSASEQREVNGAGEVVDIIDPGVDNLQYLFTLSWQAQSWNVTSIRPIR